MFKEAFRYILVWSDRKQSKKSFISSKNIAKFEMI